MNKEIRITDRSSEAFNAYLKDIKHTQPLSTEEEHELARLSQMGDINARNKLIEANLRYVITCVNDFHNKTVPMDELVAAGRLGLVIAATRYNPSFEGRFTTYAVHYIKEHIRQAIADYNATIRVPVETLKAARVAAPSVNDELDYEKLLNWKQKSVYDNIRLSLDSIPDEDDLDSRPLIETIAAGADADALNYAVREVNSDLRAFLADYYSKQEVDMLMNCAYKRAAGYTLSELAYEYRLPLRQMTNYIARLEEKAKLLMLRKKYLCEVA
jgi:RNA polymerase primary sigma factor